MITVMQLVRIFGILLLSFCPMAVSLYFYFSMVKRINELDKVCLLLKKVRQSLVFKAPNIDVYDFSHFSLNDYEMSLLKTFSDSCTSLNSSVLTENCDNLIALFNTKKENAAAEFLKKGKITAASGICAGIVLFILAI